MSGKLIKNIYIFFFCCCSAAGPSYAAAVLEWLELHDRVVVNGTKALALEVCFNRFQGFPKHVKFSHENPFL